MPNLPNKWEWLFHSDRSSEIRIKTSRWIHTRRRTREHAILRARDRDPDGTGIVAERCPLDTGTEVEATNPTNPKNDDAGTQPRRGPTRQYKIRTLFTPNDTIPQDSHRKFSQLSSYTS